MRDNLAPARALIASIINQALVDALSYQRESDRIGARRFLNKDSAMFIYYCTLLGWEPESIALNIQLRIKEYDIKRREQLLKKAQSLCSA
jgi:hypothetical protein